MRLSLNWLSDYVNVPAALPEFCDKLDLTGTGVEGIETLGESFENIVTAQIVSKEKHPDSDHMWVTMVDVGEFNLGEDGNPEPLQIVCGAQNFEQGDHIVTALVGATLPGDFKIKKSKLRGVASCGMNCSERELGLSNDHEGIIILPADAPVGVPYAEYLGKTDTVLDLEITPNRPDCLSMVGLAREVGAMYQVDVKNPLASDASKLHSYELINSKPASEIVSVEISDTERCGRYSARVIENVKIGPSPDWLAERVMAAGARSINNIVDVTNYILFLYGQPLHAFDFDKLTQRCGDKNDNMECAAKAEIIVRPAREGEILETLDGEERKLNPDMTVIATPERSVALAGVMGGADSEVTDNTTTVLLEAATFSRSHTSRTSRTLGLISESSMRYERGVDAAPIEEISAAAAALMAEVSGGTVAPGIVDIYPTPAQSYELNFDIAKFNALMGTEIPSTYIVDVLQRLGCSVANAPSGEVLAGVLVVVTPTFRPDLEREIDLFEEVIRLWGMDRVQSTLPASPERVGIQEPEQLLKRKIGQALRASGLNETMTYSFADTHDMQLMQVSNDEENEGALAVALMNPLSAEQSVMRQSILPGLLRSVAYNQHHGIENIQLYEIGTVFTTAEGRKQPKERTKLTGVLAGAMADPGWNTSPQQFDFFDGKGVLENLAFELALPKVKFKVAEAAEVPFLQPGRAAQMYSGGAVLGWIGEVHPRVAAAFDAKAPIVAFELDVNALIKAARPARDYVDVPTFPPVTMDQAFIVGEDVTAERMLQVMESAGGKLLESVRLFDVYRDDARVGAGKKSMAFALTYRDPERTLTSEEVDKAHSKLVSKVCGATNAEVRS